MSSLAAADGLAVDGIPSAGWSVGGRFGEFFVDRSTDGRFLISWTIEEMPGHNQPSDRVVFIYANGAPPAIDRVTGNEYEFAPSNPDEDRWQLDFILGPNQSAFGEWPNLDRLSFANRARLSWTVSGEIAEARIIRSQLNAPIVQADIDTPLARVRSRKLEVDPVTEGVTVSGMWTGEASAGLITIKARASDGPAANWFKWTSGARSDFLPMEDYAQEIFAGVRIRFDPSVTFAVDQTFTIVWRVPRTYLTRQLENGTWRFRVHTLSTYGLLNQGANEQAVTVNQVPPSAPTLISSSYTNGTGIANLTFAMPSEAGLKKVRVYRNYPARGNADLHWLPIREQTVTPGAAVNFTVENLQPGINLIVARCANDGAREENVRYYRLALDENLNQIQIPTPPMEIQASFTSAEGVKIVVIGVDETSDEIRIYHDNRTGTVDYGTVFTTIANPKADTNQTLTVMGLELPDGEYIVAARAASATYEEQNTDVIDGLIVDRTSPPAATDLQIELVE